MSKELIIAPAIAATPSTASILPFAVEQKAALIKRAEAIPEIITTIEERDLAQALAKDTAAHLKELEESRESVKDPYWKMCKEIDAKAKEHRTPELEPIARRLSLSLGAFAEKERLAKEAEQRRLREEQQRIENERIRLAQEAEDRRIADEAKKRKPSAAQQLRRDLDEEDRQEKLEAERKRLDQERLDLAERNRATASSGGAQRTEIDIEITDIKALYAAQPTCVKLTVDLVQLKWLINNRPELLPLPGVTFTKRPVFSTRAK